MNAGKTVHQLMEEVVLPPELELTQMHGRVSWAVKSIWEYYATWFHFDTTTELYAVPRSAVYVDLATLGSVDALAARAQEYVEARQPLHALHLMDVALEAEPRNRAALEARRAALSQLLVEAEATFQNTYELYWLRYRIGLTDAALEKLS
jgi:alkyl sulfatase BDS1-like metallo-beta-lactamase superfamily hydrolase